MNKGVNPNFTSDDEFDEIEEASQQVTTINLGDRLERHVNKAKLLEELEAPLPTSRTVMETDTE